MQVGGSGTSLAIYIFRKQANNLIGSNNHDLVNEYSFKITSRPIVACISNPHSLISTLVVTSVRLISLKIQNADWQLAYSTFS